MSYVHDTLMQFCEEAPRCTETENMKTYVYMSRWNHKYYVSFLEPDGTDYEVWSGNFYSHDDELEVRDAIREFLNPTQESPCLESKDLSTTLSKKTVLSSTKGQAVHCEVVYEMMAM